MSLHNALQDQEYPCAYPFKLICSPEAVERVRARILEQLGPDAEVTDIHQRASRSGNYIALTVMLQAQSAEQIESVYAALEGETGIVTSL